jgi:hypothetical protein
MGDLDSFVSSRRILGQAPSLHLVGGVERSKSLSSSRREAEICGDAPAAGQFFAA